jgi:hypothetical protein
MLVHNWPTFNNWPNWCDFNSPSFIIWDFSLEWVGRGKVYDYLEHGDSNASTNRGTWLEMLIINCIKLDIFQLIWRVMNIGCGATSKLHVGWWLASVRQILIIPLIGQPWLVCNHY